ncbi:bleomycin resistance protein [Halpernia frigidisoli]|uniref:Bleomycin resistance protein n=1 Tax=Halpernia frigidisoli TaxID=1125876 RepID=A0A1I3E2P8_9FLAO|nr:VOC family protein [Halpernia frigidisoli]SFH93235.1 Glyoxalase/Bleomycin resistance protein/Dioxygenase superfamily protein [Halpernia frigidisoli]
MLQKIIPKLPMRDKNLTKNFYLNNLGFTELGDWGDYFMVSKDDVEIHFFLFKDLDPKKNYGMIYIRTNEIEKIYQNFIDNGIKIHPNGKLEEKPWNQKEFSILDPDKNLLTFGQSIK